MAGLSGFCGEPQAQCKLSSSKSDVPHTDTFKRQSLFCKIGPWDFTLCLPTGSLSNRNHNLQRNIQSSSHLPKAFPLLHLSSTHKPRRNVTMISDDDLYRLAIFLGSLSMLLIVLYHFLEINAKDENKPTTTPAEKLGGKPSTPGQVKTVAR